MSEESVTCIAVQEDRHQNIMSSVCVEEGSRRTVDTGESGELFDLLGHREITLKSETEPAIIAFRNRVAEMCKAEVTTQDAVTKSRTASSRTK